MPLLTVALQDQIVQHLASGAFYDECAQSVGIGKTTFYAWLARGRTARDRAADGYDLEPQEVTYLGFVEAVEQARGRAQVHAHATIRAAMPRHWQAAAWYLERTNPRRYARRTWTEGEAPTVEELEDVPILDQEEEGADVDALLTYARRWAAEHGEAS